MKNSEKLLIGGSIIGGLAAIFGFYHAFVKRRSETDDEGLLRSQKDKNDFLGIPNGGSKKKQSRKFRKRRIKSKKR
jgi:hypothetical protein